MVAIRYRTQSEWRVVMVGQSRANYPASGNWPELLMRGRKVPWQNLCIDAAPWATLYPDAPADVFPQAGLPSVGSVLIMQGGETDVALGSSAATVYGLMSDYAVDAKAAGFTDVVAMTMPPFPSFTGGQDTVRESLNSLIVADADGSFDYVVDIAANVDLDSTGPNTWWDENGHPTDVGAALIKSLLAPTLDLILP